MTATPKPRAGEHAKGPWRVSGTGFVVAYDEVIGNDISLMNARRIVACVNFLEGIRTELIETGKDLCLDIKAERDALKRAREGAGRGVARSDPSRDN